MRPLLYTWVFAAALTAAAARAAPDDYLVVDLSAGIGGTYPIAYTNETVAAAFSDPAYKTSLLALRKIPRGSFLMGSPTNEADRATDGTEDQRSVTLSNDFYIGVFELTEGQYKRVKSGTSFSESSARPAVAPSFAYTDFIVDFLGELNRGTTTNFSLPAETQWEYACRAGTTSAYYFGSDPVDLPGYAWYIDNSYNDRKNVGGKPANAWGLYDMHGNAAEACWSYTNTTHILRGGSVVHFAPYCRSAVRLNFSENAQEGLRVCLTVPLKLYTVTVTHGTAAATSATNGQVVAIWADPPGAQQLFDRWTGDTQTVQNVWASNTTVRVQGANVALTATYREAPYSLTVYGGSGSGQYASGDLAFVSADPPPEGQLFSFWSKVPADAPLGPAFNPFSASTWLAMPPLHLILTANYAPIPTYTLTVNGGSGGGAYTNGHVVALAAAPPAPHHAFLWTGATATVADASAWETTLTMPPSNITVTATYPPIGYPLTVSGGTGGGVYTNGQTVTVTATNRPSGLHAFERWTGDTNGLADAAAPTTTVTVAGAAALAPLWRPVPVPDNTYLVVDLTASSPGQAVSYRDSVPAGGWDDGYKTNRLVLRKLAAGSFPMGSPANEPGRFANETLHTVALTEVFYVGVFEVTQAQWWRLMNAWPSFWSNGVDRLTRPVERVSYVDVRGATNTANWPLTANVESGSFIGRLRAKTGDAAFDLPTEAQWEYACRAGTTGRFSGTGSLPGMGWYGGNSGYAPHPVGQKSANAWGLYDTHGNVYELCLDWYAEAYGATSQTNPSGPAAGARRLMRGGSYNWTEEYCRSAYRGTLLPTNVWPYAGLRVARTAGPAYSLTVVDGLVNTGGLYLAGTPVPVSPARQAGWRTFLRWEVEPAGAALGGLFDAARPDTVVTQPAQAVTLRARYQTRSLLLVK